MINERLEKTRELQQQFIENQREKGRKRAKERWAGHIATAIPRLQPECQPENASSSSTSIKKTYRGFVPPLASQVKEYCQSRHNTVDVDVWIDHYISNGWMVGKNKMKDWKAAVRTWEKRGEYNGNRPGNIHENGKRPPYGEAGRNGFGSGGTGTPPIYVPEPPPDVSEETVRANLARIKEITGG